MKKPLMKDYCTPFSFDPEGKKFVCFNSKGYAKEAQKYIEFLEAKIKNLTLKNKKTA